MRIPLLAPVVLTAGLCAQQNTQQEVILDELPGYYEFYAKTGNQQILRQERRRDRQIDAGELRPVTVDRPLPPLSLPLPDGEILSLSDFEGRKNLVVVSYRSWW